MKAYGIIWGKYSAALQSQIKGVDLYDNHADYLDVFWLLPELKRAVASIDPKANTSMTMYDAVAYLYSTKQGQTKDNDTFLEIFKSSIITVELAGRMYLFQLLELTKNAGADRPLYPDKKELKETEEKPKAVLLLRNADNKRYRGLRKILTDAYFLSRYEYSVTISSMYEANY